MAYYYSILAKILVFLTFLFTPFLLVEGYGPPNLSSWCNKTPYPKQCKYYLTHNQYSSTIKGKSDFLNMMMQSAMQNAKKAHQNANSIGHSCKNKKEKAALKDCLELYEMSVQHLNQTMNTPSCTRVDTQAWLSSALTLFQTCQNGFNDLGVTKNIMPMLSNANVSCMIRNALAINSHGSVSEVRGHTNWDEPKDEFPDWVRPSDRKLLQSSRTQANLVVARDGSGDYKTIGQAISAASRRKGSERFVIHIKAGTYKENIEVGSKLKNIMFLGDGIGKTIITGSKSVGGGFTTYRSATVAVVGSGFMAQGITFQNTAGPSNHQAVALRSNSDLSVFYKCSFEGYQDTLYVHSNRQFYRECNIYGTVDFIFGNAAVVIQNCNIYTRYPPAGTNTITAQGRTDPNENTGISIHNSRVSSAEDQKGSKTYLGRPWRKYSRTVFMKTYFSNIVDPKGWLEWDGSFALSTLYYGEYANTGPGSSTSNRINWPGYHVITSPSEARKFTVENFIAGDSWLSSTGVPFTSGL
ncbi:pectinesterase 2-like [Chenopodium quinoa]|uniref:Pectinesterase n=1 Tax=Chenopodium quinoa TaxID=63459 RepID=A0A803KYS1_CHEQI|nr:pectinesterase 2-like [Chenopodium quinoa]